ncbi:DUF4329 domain-containing protein [Gammaproteobacteria bacterium]|nr:DUF4329 domain-containing protein [Gammaproteobacteria bacterium]
MRIARFPVALALLLVTGVSWAQMDRTAVVSGVAHGESFSTTVKHYYRTSRHQALSQFNGSEVTTISLHRTIGANVLHYGNTWAADEKHQYLGFSAGPATASFFHGSGRSISQTGSALYQDLNHYYFHGGNHSPFSFQGGGLDLDVGRGASAQFAGVRIKTPNVEDRAGYYAGLTAGRWAGGMFALERGSEGIGHGFNFSYSGNRSGFEFQEIQTDTGAHMRRLGFNWRSRRGTRWSMDLEEARNPLYASGDERRLMVRYQRSFGRTMSFSAAEESGEATKKHDRYGKVLAIGLGVGAVALAVSSGDSGGDNAQRFATPNEAAFDVMNRINPVSVRENREHGGWIYRSADGSFASTTPVAGGVASVNIGNPVTAVPQGTTANASYHTHGGPDPRYDNENFSPQDILSDIMAGVNGYLGTPAGFLKQHLVAANQVIVLGRIAN